MNSFLAKRYLHYLIFSWHKFGHGVHSPFVYQLVREVFNDKTLYPEYKLILDFKNTLLNNNASISVTDFGTKYGVLSNERTVDYITRSSAIRNKYGKLLFRLVNRFKPQNILELGSSVGISSSWMALASPDSKIVTIEGCQNIAQIASNTLCSLNVHNVTIINGTFEQHLTPALSSIKKLDFAFIDGNHNYQSTIKYFNAILPFCNHDTILVFDDIHWSLDMEQAWNEICKHPTISQTIDLLQLGIVFFRKGVAKEDFVIRF